MKKYIIALCLIIVSGCKPNDYNDNSVKNSKNNSYYELNDCIEISVTEVDSCQYVVANVFGNGVSIIHKQNCKYCLKRK